LQPRSATASLQSGDAARASSCALRLSPRLPQLCKVHRSATSSLTGGSFCGLLAGQGLAAVRLWVEHRCRGPPISLARADVAAVAARDEAWRLSPRSI
jgi:hypothetical protein